MKVYQWTAALLVILIAGALAYNEATSKRFQHLSNNYGHMRTIERHIRFNQNGDFVTPEERQEALRACNAMMQLSRELETEVDVPIVKDAHNICEKIRSNDSFTLADDKEFLKYFDLYDQNFLVVWARLEAVRPYFMFLTLALAIAFAALFVSLIRRSNQIQNLNAELEKRVHERTADLSGALDQNKAQQQMLVSSAKMSALGEMAGGIAHEINTPLAAIMLHAEMAQTLVEDQQAVMDHTGDIIHIVEKISKIVVGLKKFARADEAPTRTPTTFEALISDSLLLCGERLRHKSVSLEIKIDDNAKDQRVSCASEQISQIIMNLLNNAIDAVETRETKKIQIHVSHAAHELVFRMTDTGGPIPEEVRAKLMQPFFTTKPIGKGTGLGLSISRGIADAHGGSLELAPGPTTCFVLRLPEAS